jgi:putative nucleotidyltransferase with HDIG domain
MKKSLNYLVLSASIVFTIISLFYSGEPRSKFSNLVVGQISDKTILAPFDFDVLKSQTMLNQETKRLLHNVRPIYKISDDVNFEIYKRLNSLNEEFALRENQKVNIVSKKKFFIFGQETEKFLNDKKKRLNLYKKISNEMNQVLQIGIYCDSLQVKNITLFSANHLKTFDVNRLYSLQEAINKLSIKISKFDIPYQIIKDILTYILEPNIVYDSQLTGEIKQKQLNKIIPLYTKVLKNEAIIRKNQKITETDILKLESLQKQLNKDIHRDQRKNFIYIISSFLFFLILNIFIIIILHYFKMLQDESINNYLVIFSIVAIFMIIFILLSNNQISSKFFPYSLPIFLTYFIYKNGVTIPFGIYLIFLLSYFPNSNLSIMNISVMTSILSTLIVCEMHKDEHTEIFSLFWIFIFLFSLVSFSFSYIKYQSFSFILSNYFYILLSSILSFLIAAFIYPSVQKRINIVNKQILLELINYDIPLLKKLANVAPGTYHHSLIVGNLAESAAEAIGADPLLARVGSYYHDIGKISEPEIFIENNENAALIHYKLSPEESAEKIKNHINIGINLATDYKLPKIVIDIIKQHHGNSYVKYFLNKAKESKRIINISDFKYDGPLPNTKEAAIVMISDIVESTVKSLKRPSSEEMKEVIENSIKNLVIDKQLIDTQLTFSDLEKIKQTFIPILEGIYRHRVEYK